MEPLPLGPEDFPIYGPPTPGAFEGMLDGYQEEVVPGLGVADEDLEVGPHLPNAELICEPGDPPSHDGGGISVPGIADITDEVPSIEAEERRLHRENVEKDPYGYFRDLY